MWLYSSVTHCLSCVVLRGLLSCHRATRPDVFTSWPFSEQVLTVALEDRQHQNSRRVCRRRLTVSHPFSCVGSIFPLRGRGAESHGKLTSCPLHQGTSPRSVQRSRTESPRPGCVHQHTTHLGQATLCPRCQVPGQRPTPGAGAGWALPQPARRVRVES